MGCGASATVCLCLVQQCSQATVLLRVLQKGGMSNLKQVQSSSSVAACAAAASSTAVHGPMASFVVTADSPAHDQPGRHLHARVRALKLLLLFSLSCTCICSCKVTRQLQLQILTAVQHCIGHLHQNKLSQVFLMRIVDITPRLVQTKWQCACWQPWYWLHSTPQYLMPLAPTWHLNNQHNIIMHIKR